MIYQDILQQGQKQAWKTSILHALEADFSRRKSPSIILYAFVFHFFQPVKKRDSLSM